MATDFSDSPDLSTRTSAEPTLVYCETTTIYAFPTSLAVIGQNALDYDCTPWLSECPKDGPLFWKAMNVVQSKQGERDYASAAPILPVLPFGTSTDVHVYAVFPHLKTIGRTAECAVFKTWHDEVIRPSFHKVSRAAPFFNHELPVSHGEVIQRIETQILLRSQLGHPETPLNPVQTRVGPHNLGAIWETIMQQTTQRGFQEFRDVFLVVVFDPTIPMYDTVCYGQTNAPSHGESLSMAMKIWERNVDMEYVPKGKMEYRVQGTWCV